MIRSNLIALPKVCFSGVIFILLLILLLIGCKTDSTGQYAYQQPENINDGLAVGTLSEVNIDAQLIAKVIQKIKSGRFREIHSMLIYKDDKLVLEEYFSGHKYVWDAPNHHGAYVKWDKSMLHYIMSDTKSITSACIGIAIDQGFIENVNQSIFEYLPDYQQFNNGGKNEITIEHLLTMTSGLEGNEWTSSYNNLENPIIALWFPPCEDPVNCILEKPLVHTPGSHFSYFGGNMIVEGKIIEHATGMQIDDFSKEYLFEPLGIDSADWAVRFENGVIEAAGGLRLTPRAMLKIGVTYLNDGRWKGQQVVPEQWVEKSANPYAGNRQIKVPGTDVGRAGYSYSWWTMQFEIGDRFVPAYYAGGWGGQKIIVIPELNSVIVLTGGTYTSKVLNFKFLRKWVVPALIK